MLSQLKKTESGRTKKKKRSIGPIYIEFECFLDLKIISKDKRKNIIKAVETVRADAKPIAVNLAKDFVIERVVSNNWIEIFNKGSKSNYIPLEQIEEIEINVVKCEEVNVSI